MGGIGEGGSRPEVSCGWEAQIPVLQLCGDWPGAIVSRYGDDVSEVCVCLERERGRDRDSGRERQGDEMGRGRGSDCMYERKGGVNGKPERCHPSHK